MSAIFISHSSKDNAWAERIRVWLQDEHQQRPVEHRYRSLFLDFDPDDGIHPAEPWRDMLFERLQLCAAVIVICSEAYAASQWCLAELGIAMVQGKLVLPVRIDASPLPKLLSETQSTALAVIDLEEGSPSGWHRLQNGLAPLSWQARLLWPPADKPDASPFPGLVCFEREHAPVFFGQDAVLKKVQEALQRLTAAESRLLLILGASGCGKSSLLRAGVVPWLAEADRRRWIVLDPFRPEDDPFGWLSAAIAKAYGTLGQVAPAEPARKAATLHGQLRGLRRHAQQQDAKVVLAIDQFEELLGREGSSTDPGAAVEADTFLTMLAELLALENSRVVILATLRSDFFGILQLHPCGLHRLAGELIQLGPMDQAGFRQVIEGPARRVGLVLETGLSDELVHDTATGDALPLLAFTLSELWRERPSSRRSLTLQQYRHIGGLAGAVQKKADEVLATSAPTELERAALREAFLDHLVRLSDEGMAAKRPARWGDLPAASQRILRRFVDARLLVSGKGETRDTVEIAHEALLRTWPTLRDWFEDSRQMLEQKRRVARLCEDMNSPQADVRFGILKSLMAMAVYDPQTVQLAERQLTEVLADGWRLRKEWLVAARVLDLIGGKKAETAMRDLLQREVLLEETDRPRVAEVLHLSCMLSIVQLRLAIRLRSSSGNKANVLLVPSAKVRASCFAVSTVCVKMPLLTSPELDAFPNTPWGTAAGCLAAYFEGLTAGVALTMIRIPSGCFLIRSSDEERELDRTEEGPQHNVEVDAFFLSRMPITQAQWRAVATWQERQGEQWGLELNPDPSHFQGSETRMLEGESSTDERPVEQVSFHEAMEFCSRLSQRTKRTYTLPTEAQWEYACRAGTTTPFHCGPSIMPKLANYDGTKAYRECLEGENRQQTTPVGFFPANDWGLQDMLGNVWEWCLDHWHESYEGAPSFNLPWLASEGTKETNRVVRGGSWRFGPVACRSSVRTSYRPGILYQDVGFRVCCLQTPGSLLDPSGP